MAESSTIRRIAVGADHGGYEFKEAIKAHLQQRGLAVEDCGTNSTQPVDYPLFARLVAQRVSDRQAERGIMVDRAGIGSAMAANKVPGVRACLIHECFSARQGVEDDNMNTICLGGRVVGNALAWELVEMFLHARFSGAARHRRRLAKVAKLESRDAES